MKINKKVLFLGTILGLGTTLVGCTGQPTVIRTNEFTIQGEAAYKSALDFSARKVLEAQLKVSDVKLLNKIYGSNTIDESKLLSQAKVKSGSAYLDQIGQDSGLRVTNDEEAKDALRYMEQQKLAAKEMTNDLFTDEDAKLMLESNMTYSVKHVLVKSEDDANKMKEYLISGAENFDALKEKSIAGKKAGSSEVTSDKGIVMLEAADYPNVPKGQMVAEFETAAVKTSPLNAWSDPIKTSYGFHIQYVYARTESTDMVAAKQKISEKMIESNKSNSTVISQAMVKLREKNNFTITDEALAKDYEAYKTELVAAFNTEKTSILSGNSASSQVQTTQTA